MDFGDAAAAAITTDPVREVPPATGEWNMGWPTSALQGLALSVGRTAAVFLLFSLATALIFSTTIPHFHSALIGPPEDNMQDFWNTWYASVGADPAHFFFTKLLRVPEGTPLLYHSFAYPQIFA